MRPGTPGPRAEPGEVSGDPTRARNPPGQHAESRAELAASPRAAPAQQQLGLRLTRPRAALGAGREHARGARARNTADTDHQALRLPN